MKIRRGFVSNSSSSSFICDVCGEEYSGMDATLEDAEMIQCKNQHTICIEHLIFDDYNVEDVIEYAKRCLDENDKLYIGCEEKREEIQEFLDGDRDNIDCYIDSFVSRGCEEKSIVHMFCPLCRFTSVSKDEVIRYLLKLNNTTIKELENKILSTFENYEQFDNFIYGK
jgi:hypothetical protein